MCYVRSARWSLRRSATRKLQPEDGHAAYAQQ
jgi:hypothetical protein